MEREHWIIILLVLLLCISLCGTRMIRLCNKVRNDTLVVYNEPHSEDDSHLFRISSTVSTSTTTTITSSTIPTTAESRDAIFDEVFQYLMSCKDNESSEAPGNVFDSRNCESESGRKASTLPVDLHKESCPTGSGKRVRFSVPDDCCHV